MCYRKYKGDKPIERKTMLQKSNLKIYLATRQRSLFSRIVQMMLDLAQHILLLLAFLMFFSYVQVATAADSSEPLSNVNEGTLFLLGSDDEQYLRASAISTDLEMRVTDMINYATVTQVFRNTSVEKVEGLYALSLPEDIKVDSVQIIIGDKTIKTAFNSEQQHVFTTPIVHIGPYEGVRVKIMFQQPVKYEQGLYKFRTPLFNTALSNENSNVPVSLHLELDAGFPVIDIGSLSHEIHLSRHGEGRYSIRFKDDATFEQKDFELTWMPDPGYVPNENLKLPANALFGLKQVARIDQRLERQTQTMPLTAQTATDAQLKVLVGLICAFLAFAIKAIIFMCYSGPHSKTSGIVS